jgi:hypothetical protein
VLLVCLTRLTEISRRALGHKVGCVGALYAATNAVAVALAGCALHGSRGASVVICAGWVDVVAAERSRTPFKAVRPKTEKRAYRPFAGFRWTAGF